jgi:hypothetical protein
MGGLVHLSALRGNDIARLHLQEGPALPGGVGSLSPWGTGDLGVFCVHEGGTRRRGRPRGRSVSPEGSSGPLRYSLKFADATLRVMPVSFGSFRLGLGGALGWCSALLQMNDCDPGGYELDRGEVTPMGRHEPVHKREN